MDAATGTTDNISTMPSKSPELSTRRLHMMRFVYLVTGVFVGTSTWPALVNHAKPWDPLHGIAFSFWAAYSVLMLWGVRFPVRMLPLMLLQIFYKLTWLIAVAYPLWSAGRLDPTAHALIKACAGAAAFDLFAIPWPYVFDRFIKPFGRSTSSTPSDRSLLAA